MDTIKNNLEKISVPVATLKDLGESIKKMESCKNTLFKLIECARTEYLLLEMQIKNSEVLK